MKSFQIMCLEMFSDIKNNPTVIIATFTADKKSAFYYSITNLPTVDNE